MYLDTTLIYDAVVVSNQVDPQMRGAVRARIIGYTDEIDDDAQPYVYPELGDANAVPEKGYYLRVRFYKNDITTGRYIAVSQTKNGFYASEYNSKSNYPNIAVYNCGGDEFLRTYDRSKQLSQIDCPNGGHITWDGESKILMHSDKSYANAGDGAKQESGKDDHNVLTEASIDIFTCMPVGHGMINQGSEYLTISHVSKKTIETYKNPEAEDKSSGDTPVSEGDPQATKLPIMDANGKKVDEVELSLCSNTIKRFDKEISKIIIGVSDSKNFPEMADEFMKEGSKSSAHYLVGRIEGDPEVASDNPFGTLNNSGFLQFVPLNQDAYYGNGLKDADGNQATYNAVSIVLIASEKKISSISGYTNYQKTLVKQLIAHIRHEAGDDTIPVILASDLKGSPALPKISESFE